MANSPQQDDRFYRPNVLIKVFGISSIVMLIFTIWMVLDDFGREWKGFQLEFFQLKEKVTKEQLKSASDSLDQTKLKASDDAVAKGVAEIKAKEKDVDRLDKELVALKTKLLIATNRYQGAKIVWDVEKYQHESKYGHQIAEGHLEATDPKAKASVDKLEKGWDKVVALRDTMNNLDQANQDKQKERDNIFADKTKAEKNLKVVRAEVDRLKTVARDSDMTLSKLVRNAPILDLASPVLKIQQIVIPTIRDDIFFSRVQKIDRCTTCHMAIDLPGFEKQPNPFRTHPNLELMLGGRSPHPIDTIGCTVCHGGRGQSVDFVRSAHTPRDEEQKKEWKKKYHWEEMHHVIEKMVPLPYTEGQCRVCHRETEYVPKAQKLTAANQLIRSTGCYGCHKLPGWEHMRKPAPSLKRVKGKLEKDWIVKWVRSPKSFNEFARMPASFHQSNITTDEFKQFQEAEIFAAADFILDESEDYQPDVHLSLGNAEKGKELFGKVGCLACHGMNDYNQTRYGQAPNLSTVGSKVSKDWLLSWIKNPRHYWEGTIMPSLRLTDNEAQDIAAYLLSKKNPEFEALPVGTPSAEIQKKVLRMYLMRDPKLAPNTEGKVEKVLASMNEKQISHDLGKNVVSRYGCYTCHEIKNFETTPSIAPELGEVGSKPINKFDFGLAEIEHTNHDWIETKLKNPRIYDKGQVKEYLDLLKMPNFYLEEDEIKPITMALLGYTSQKIDAPSAKVLSAKEAKAEEGIRVIHQYNCQGCHIVENLFQPPSDDDPEKEKLDKLKRKLEGRILAYFEEDDSLGPPPIAGEGKKVFTSWVHDFIHAPYPLRASLKVRMPTFQLHNEQINQIVTGWGLGAGVEFPFSEPQRVKLTPQQAENAKKLVARLQCLNCHAETEKVVITEDSGSRGLAPSFWHSAKRLRREWIVEWLKDPQKVQPGTRMPGFWPDGQSMVPEVLDGNSEAQIQLLADWVISVGQNALPRPVSE